MADSCCVRSLVYMNARHADQDATAKEILSFHFEATVRWLSGIFELQDYHVNYPWRCVLALRSGDWGAMLQHMKEEWEMVKHLDTTDEKSALFKMISFTRLPVYRELMIEAEHPSYIYCSPVHVHVGGT